MPGADLCGTTCQLTAVVILGWPGDATAAEAAAALERLKALPRLQVLSSDPEDVAWVGGGDAARHVAGLRSCKPGLRVHLGYFWRNKSLHSDWLCFHFGLSPSPLHA